MRIKGLLAFCAAAALALIAGCTPPPTNGAMQPIDEHNGTPQPGASSSF